MIMSNIPSLGKWMELENIILTEITQTQKDMHGMYSLISGYSPPKKYRIPRIQFSELKKFNKLKGPNEDALIPLGSEKKVITGVGRERPGWKRQRRREEGNMIE